MKRTWTLGVIVAILALPLAAFAGQNKLVVGTATIAEDNTVTVPLEVTNDNELAGIDVALKYSSGVTVKEIRFEGTRTEYFDLKASYVDTENQTFIIMMVPQTSMREKPHLTAGHGPIAYIVFEVEDPSIREIELEPTVMEEPHHSCFFVYSSTSTGEYQQWRQDPTFEGGRIMLSAAAGGSLPTQFSLNQNYPNPFNPTTEIAFALPKASTVELSVFNVLGQQVRSLLNQPMEAGLHKVTWDGKDQGGSSVSSGVYFYRINAGGFNETRKMMLLK